MKIFHHYDIAYRNNKDDVFKVINNPPYGWAADPFLVEYEGAIYLFAEIFLYKSERNGVIGYRKYFGMDDWGPWTITMDKHWHLSYPYVFVDNGNLYLIPESYQLEEVVLYQLVCFPNNWKKVKTIIPNVEYCDSTLLKWKDGAEYIFTFEREAISPKGKGWIYKLMDGVATEGQFISDSLEGTRCGGKVIVEGNRYIRVGQNCSREYGGGLIFYEIDSVWPNYSEHELFRVEPSNIEGNFKKAYCGVHTYNRLGDLEVIDLRYESSTAEENEASERVHKVFLNKYE